MAVRELGYLVFASRDVPGWRATAADVIGLQAADADGALYLKMDDRDFRIAVVPGDEERLVACGLEVANKAEFAEMRARIEASGALLEDGTQTEIKLRRVQDFYWTRDPAGNRVEIFWGHISGFLPFRSPLGIATFVTEGLGLGHAVLPAENLDETQAFWTDVLGFGLSDILTLNFGGHDVKLYFNHCSNGRQHTVALARMPSPTGCVHFMLEMPTLKDVGRAHDRVTDAGLPFVLTMGQHVNDDCVSFYFRSPAGYMIEIGWESVIKDWDRHSVFETTLPSHWGHRYAGG